MRRTKEAIVLAGGFGTRLSSVVNDVPKPMATVANRPFLRYLLDLLDANRFARVVIADGYKREYIEKYFGNQYRGLSLVYSPEETPLLTGGAVKKALTLCKNQWVFVFNGDTYLDADFEAFDNALGAITKSQVTSTVDAFIATKQMADFSRYGTLNVSQGTIVSFNEKQPCSDGLINAGVYLLRKNALDCCPSTFSLETDFFEQTVKNGKLKSVECNGAFIDIGTPEDYLLSQKLLAPLAKHWKLALFDRDGTINADTGHLFEPNKLELLPKGIRLLRHYAKKKNYKIVVVTNQAGIAKGYYTEKEMHALHDNLDKELEKRDCRIDAYYSCPHHPDFTGPCQCRKPAPGMILKAMFDYDAKPDDCILFGDRNTDVAAANNAGIKGVQI